MKLNKFIIIVFVLYLPNAQAKCLSTKLHSQKTYSRCQIEDEGKIFLVDKELIPREEDCENYCSNVSLKSIISQLVGINKAIHVLFQSEFKCAEPISSNASSSGVNNSSKLEKILSKEGQFNLANPCKILIVKMEKFDGICGEIKKIYEENHLLASNAKCERVRVDDGDGEYEYGKITLQTDRIINMELFYNRVGQCYEKANRTSISKKRMTEVYDLVAEAEKYFRKLQITQKSKAELNVNSTTPTSEILDKLLEKNRDVIIGESHGEVSPKKAIIDNMAILKKHGASLVLEHVLYEPYQKLLDEYLSSKSEDLPPRLKIYLQNMDRGHRVGGALSDQSLALKYNYTQLVKVAKAHGVRVIAIETEAAYLASTDQDLGHDPSISDRLKTMNFMNKLITDHERKGGKLVHFIGSSHTNTREGIPGVAELMGGAPTITIADSRETQRSIDTHVDLGDEDIKADFYIQEPMSFTASKRLKK